MLPLMSFGDDFVGPPAPPPAPDEKNQLDAPREYVSGKFVDFVSSIDRFFGTDRNYQETNDSVLQLDIFRVMGYGGGNGFVPSARANIHLPMAEKKLHLLIESDPDKNASVDPKQTQSPPLSQPSAIQSYAAALRIERSEAERWHLSLDGGVKFHGVIQAPTPFVRSRASLAVPLDLWNVRLSETAFWFNTIGAGETTQMDWERPISAPLMFRASSYATWLNDTQNFDLRQDAIVFHKLDERTALMYQASAIGVARPSTVVTEYVVLALYRYRLHRDWMFLEVSPQLHFPRALGFHTEKTLSLRLEMLFDKAK